MQQQEELGVQFGKYNVYAKLAVGGMAELFLAHQPSLAGFRKTLVLKCILPHLVQEEQFVTMFFDEARVASHLDHPNIVQIQEIGEIAGIYYIAMEYIRGKSFKAVRQRLYKERLDRDSRHYGIITGMVAQAAAGLQYAHTAMDEQNRHLRLVHRDICPTNLLVSYNGAVKIVDFGVAKATIQEHQTHAGTIKGKYRYMSPEQLADRDLDHRSDIFSLGIVLYEMSTNVGLFKRRTEFDTIQAVSQARVVPPSKLHSSYPPALEKIVMKALERYPNDRYQSADEFRQDLESFMRDHQCYHGQNQLAETIQQLFVEEMEGERTGMMRNTLSKADFYRLAGSSSMSSGSAMALSYDHRFDSMPPANEVNSTRSMPQGRAHLPATPPMVGQSGQYQHFSQDDQINTQVTPSQLPQVNTSGMQLPTSGVHPASALINEGLATSDSNPRTRPQPASPPRKKRGGLLWLVLLLALVGGLGAAYLFSKQYNSSQQVVVGMNRVETLFRERHYNQALWQLRNLRPLLKRSYQRSWFREMQSKLSLYPKLERLQRQVKQAENDKNVKMLLRQQKQLEEWMAIWSNNKDLRKLLVRVNASLLKLRPPQRPRPEPNPGDAGAAPEKRPPATKRKKPRRRYYRRRLRRRRIRTYVAPRRVEPRVAPERRRPRPPVIRKLKPTRGILSINARPLATVFVSGRRIGNTPLKLAMRPGLHRITLSKRGYHSVERRIQLTAGQQLDLDVSLRPRNVASTTPRLVPRPRTKPKARYPFSKNRLPKRQSLRILLLDPRGIGGMQHTQALDGLCRRVEKEAQRLLGTGFVVRGITRSWRTFVRGRAAKRGETLRTFYPRAMTYVIYQKLLSGRSARRVAQMLVAYEYKRRFRRISP